MRHSYSFHLFCKIVSYKFRQRNSERIVLTKTKIIAESLHKDHVLSYVLHEAYKETQISRKR